MLQTEPLDHDLRMAWYDLKSRRDAATGRLPKCAEGPETDFAVLEAKTMQRAMDIIEEVIQTELSK